MIFSDRHPQKCECRLERKFKPKLYFEQKIVWITPFHLIKFRHIFMHIVAQKMKVVTFIGGNDFTFGPMYF